MPAFVCMLSWYVYAAALTGEHGRLMDHQAWELFFKCWDQLAEGLDDEGNIIFLDDHGTPVKFIMLFAGGDMEKLCAGWGLKSYGAADEMCLCCTANRSDRPFTNLHDSAEWRPSCPMPNNVRWYC